jgi:acyl-CoA synthetase (AMP-forming)/AMP-acid ligase II
MPNGPDWIASWLAVSRIGGICIALSTFAATRELAYAVRHADVAILLTADRYLRHDYCARLEEAFPGLADHDGREPLVLEDCPYLRSIWVAGAAPKWAAGALADLEAKGRDSSLFTETLLAQVEAEVAPSDPCIMIYTSGSTALPKAVVHLSGAVVSKAEFLAASDNLIPANVEPGDRMLVTAAMFWVGGLDSLIGGMIKGACILCVDDHSPASLLEAIRRDKATHVGGSEAVMRSIAAVPGWKLSDFDRLKVLTASQHAYFVMLRDGATVSREQVPDSLGMTETIGPHSGVPSGELRPPGGEITWGRALDQMELKIVDPETREPVPAGEMGELLVRGPWLMDGFYKRLRRDAFDADGWYPTGDRCFLDAEGYLYFRGRLGGMIKTSGANVSPEEVEAAIRLDPEVLDVAVFPVADPKRDQMVVAVVAPKPGSAMTEASVKARLRDELSSFKVPKRILFMDYDALPRTASNKVRRPVLAEMVAPQIIESETAA